MKYLKRIKLPIDPAGKNGGLFWMACILAVIALVYSKVFQNQLTNWDDDLYILKNPFIKNLSFANLKNIFSTFFAGNYHPLTMVSLALDYRLGGINPWPYQLTNLLLHLGNTLLVFLFVRQLMLIKIQDKTQVTMVSLIAAALFGIHELQVESVAWISERKNLLYSFFFFLSLIAYTRYIARNNYRLYFISLFIFLLSLLSKGMAVPLSLCVITIDFFAGRHLLSRRVVLEKITFLLLSLVFGIIAIMAQHEGNAIRTEGITIHSRIAISAYGFTQYILKLIFPFRLSAYYPYPVGTGENLPMLYYLYVFVPGLLFFSLWKYFRYNKIVVFGTLFFLINISIVLQLIPVGDAIMADRYVYVASVGFFIIAGSLFTYLWQKYKGYRNILFTVFVVYGYALGLKTCNRVAVWKDGLTLWNDSLKKYPGNNDRGYLNRGNIYFDMGKMDEARKDYERTLQIDSGSSASYIGIGMIRLRAQDHEGALESLNKALTLSKAYEAYINRAVVKIEIEDYTGAGADLDTAYHINPLRPDVHVNRGVIHINTGNTLAAVDELNKAIEMNRYNYQAYYYRGFARIKFADYENAVSDLNISLDLQPTANAFYFRALAFLALNKKPEGCEDIRQAASMGYEPAYELLNQYCAED